MTDFPAVIDLSTLDGTDGFRLDGIDAYDFSGFSVSSAGDVNGDGFEDIIIGARLADPSGVYGAGQTYLVFGKASGFAASLDLSILDGNNGFRLNGIDAHDHSGSSVSSAGDINGDGFDDLVIGAPNADVGGGSAGSEGETYVVFGKASGFPANLDLSTLDGSNGFRLDGIDRDDRSGYAVSSAGDMNGDGFDDIIIGADFASEGYVVFGKASGFTASLDLSTLDGSNGFRLDGGSGTQFGFRTGRSVSSVGDINGDGFDDVIIGAYNANSSGVRSGESYVVFGKSSGFAATIHLNTLDGTDGFRLNGIDEGDRSGFSVSAAGDVNGDGFDDLIIGAPYADVSANGFEGEAYVVFGRDSGFSASLDLSLLDGSDGFRLIGVSSYDRSGWSVASAGDVNGDGFDDVIVGAPKSPDAGPSGYSGQSYVVFGKASGFASSLDLSMLDGTNGFRLDGIDRDDRSGYAVSSAGDMNGDGFDDIIIGAIGADPGGEGEAGESYVVFGRAPTQAVTRIGAAGDQTILGGDFNDTLNGRGGDDTLIGGNGSDTLLGKGGRDILIGGEGSDSLDGGAGKDTASYETAPFGVTVSLLNPALNTGGATGDTFVSIESLTGTAFDDSLFGDDDANALSGLDGNDTLIGNGGDDVLMGGKGRDLLIGGNGNDWLDGEEGGDTLDGGAGNDTLLGGIQSDTILGDIGNDTIEGANGGDTINGGAGQDNIIGQGGTDEIDGAGGSDTISGGNGADTIRGGARADTINGNDGSDTIFGGGGQDVINAGKARDVVNGQGGNDIINGNSEKDTLSGGGGDDIINGGSGNDILKGQTGDDILNGQQGDDILTGNAGNDIFMFNGQGNDTITDMLSGNPLRDQIDVSSQGFANFNQVMARATQVGNDVVFNIGSGSLTVENHAISDFVANDFIL